MDIKKAEINYRVDTEGAFVICEFTFEVLDRDVEALLRFLDRSLWAREGLRQHNHRRLLRRRRQSH